MQDLEGRSIKGYELRERIGAGGYGAVYRAFQSTVGREVAIKIILPGFTSSPDFIRRFETEAQLVARLEHLHIAPLYDYWREPSGAYLVMRYLRGGNLRDAMRQAPYDLEATALLLDQLSSALTHAHANKVIHRDIKPENILMDEDGNAYLADFGIAKDIGPTNGNVTDPGMMIGSPDYLAPEQARSEPVTAQTDIYSLGVVLYEILAGQHPFPDLSPVERLFKHINERIPEITIIDEDVASQINEVIHKATAKNPETRFPSVQSMATAFREAAGLGVSQPARRLIELLTPREQEVLKLIVEGKSNREIAEALTIELTTVKWYVTQIYKKLGVRSRVQAIVRARELNLIIDGQFSESATTGIITGLPEPENPYKGLKAFQVADEHQFYGREKLIEKLLSRLQEQGDHSRFLAIVGPSGSGKSSLVRAGLIPALWRGGLPGSEKWFIADMIPGSRPLDELEIALLKIASEQPSHLMEQLERDGHGLLRAAQLILPDDGTELLLVVDQFEELFTLVDHEGRRAQFMDLIVEAVEDPRSRVRVVVTLRADFYDRPLQYPGFGELMQSRIETVLPLSAEELERAIARPVESIGVNFEEGLVASIIEDVHYQPGALPLMQYALTELFDDRSNHTLTREAYLNLGGSVGALAKRVDEIYMELDEEGRAEVRQMFLRLVTLGEGVEDTRRRVPRSELLAIGDDLDRMDELIDLYTASRLLSSDIDPGTRSPTVELAHEAILREWERFKEWLAESREDIRLQRALALAAAEWRAADRDPSFLLRGTRLGQFENWSERSSLVLTIREKKFLRASLEAAEEEQQEKEAQIERELEAAKGLRRRAIYLAVALVAAVGLALAAGVFARQATSSAELAQKNLDLAHVANTQVVAESNIRATAEAIAIDEANIARAREIAAFARANIQSDPELGVLLALASLDVTRTGEAESTLHQALQNLRLEKVFGEPGQDFIKQPWSIEYSPDGEMLVTGHIDGVVKVWSVETGEELLSWQAHARWIPVLAISMDGRLLATGSFNAEVKVWDLIASLEVGEPVDVLTITDHPEKITDLSFSPLGTQLATASEDGAAMIWDLNDGSLVLDLSTSNSGPASIEFSPSGTVIATGGDDGTVGFWDVSTGNQLAEYEAEFHTLFESKYNPQGTLLAVANIDGGVWSLEIDPDTSLPTGREFFRVPSFCHGGFNGIEWTPDGRRLAGGCQTGILLVRDALTGEEVLRLSEGIGAPSQVAIGPGCVGPPESPAEWCGMRLASAHAGGAIRLWNLAPSASREILTVSGIYAYFTENGDHLITLTPLGFDGKIDFGPEGPKDMTGHIWKLPNISEASGSYVSSLPSDTFTFSRAESGIQNGYLNTDGTRVVNVDFDNNIYIRESLTGELISEFPSQSHIRTNWGIAVDSSGSRVATALLDGTVRIMSAETGADLLVLDGQFIAPRLSFSTDDKWLATGGMVGATKVWDSYSGELVHSLSGHNDPARQIAFSPNGSLLATGYQDATAKIWDLSSGEELWTLSGYSSAVSPMSFSPNGEILAVASAAGEVRLVNVASGEEIATLTEGDRIPPFTMQFSPDGRRLVVGDLGRWTRVFIVPIDDLVELARGRVTRSLSDAECQQYLHIDECP